MQRIIFSLFVLVCFQQAIAQKATQQVDMLSANWSASEKATFETFDNRETLVLSGGRISAKGIEFTNGTIEVDVYANAKRSFAGITFRKQKENMEEVYMRMHKSRQVDALQYTPIFNNESSWQLYREYQAQITFKNTGWNTLRIEVSNGTAQVFVNDEKVLSIDHLRTENATGEVGLFALFTNRFSNFRVTHKDAAPDIKDDTVAPVDDNLITQWKITEAKPFKTEAFEVIDFSRESYTTVTTEKSGLLPISKYVKKSRSGNFEQNTEDYIVAAAAIEASDNETRLFSFDYSDKIMVYLNGKLLFRGNNAFRAKGPQHTGHIAVDANTLYLPLKKGSNMIHCVVIDKANGWGLIGKLE